MAHLNEIQKIVSTVGKKMETIMNGATMNITIKCRLREETSELSVFKESDDLYRIDDIEYSKLGVIAQVSLFLIRNIFESYSYSILLSTQREVSDSKMDLSSWFIESRNSIPRQLALIRKYKPKENDYSNIGLTSWI